MFFFGSGISRNLSLAPHKHRGTLPCTKAPAPPTIPDVKSENPSLFGHQLAEQNGVANVGETSSWLEKVRTEYGVLRKKSALYLWNPDWLWLILYDFIIDHKVTRFSQGYWRSALKWCQSGKEYSVMRFGAEVWRLSMQTLVRRQKGQSQITQTWLLLRSHCLIMFFRSKIG